MGARYRIVWNTRSQVCSITARTHGFDAQIDDSAAAALFAANQATKPAASAERNARFLQEAVRFGWLNSRYRLNGSMVKFQEEHQLKRIQIESTTKCNLRCSYCYSGSGPSCTAALSHGLIQNILSEADKLGCTWVDFTGGEFLLIPQWMDILQDAMRRDFVITVHSNGTTLTEANLEIIRDVGVRRLQVSLDSHRPHVHDKIRGRPGAFDKTVQGIRLAKQLGINLRISIVVHKYNKDEIGEFVKWCANDLDVAVAIDRVIPAGGELEARVGVNAKEYFELVAPLISRDVISAKICENSDANLNTALVEPACGIGQSFVYITADGEIALCPTMTSRDKAIFAGPNIREMSLSDAWLHSSHFKQFRFVNCRNTGRCPAAKACGGGCRSNAYLETGELDSPDFISCNLNKNASEKFVDYAYIYAAGRTG